MPKNQLTFNRDGGQDDDNDDQLLSTKAINRIIGDLLDPGRWVQMPLSLIQVLSSDEAVLFALIFNHFQVVKNKHDCEDGWFFFYAEEICRRTGWAYDKQSRFIRRLKELKLIKTEMRGMPPKRWIKINFVQLGKMI